MRTILSFCITVYNQSDLVRDCINSIISYKGNDIEIVISDDGSDEDIKGLIEEFKDSRIKYHVNESNLGHDRNILNALSKATGQYAFVLRTRDLIISDAIPTLIEVAETNQASYITGEAINQKGNIKIHYTRECYKQGDEAIDANYKLFMHPSGNMYRLADLDLEKLNDFLDKNRVSKNGFIVHNMIRLQLATTGDFRLIKKPVWVYTDTEVADDRAVNRSKGGVGVYDPSLLEERYQNEVKWAKSILTQEQYRQAYYLLMALYLDMITWGFKVYNSDKKTQHHYDYKEIDFSVFEQRKNFKKICESLYDEWLGEEKIAYQHLIKKIFRENVIKGSIKYIIRKATYGTPAYTTAAKVYKKYIKGL